MPIGFLKKKPDLFDYSASRLCKSCERTFSGKFCNVCGEKIIEPADKSIVYFFGSILNAFTALDDKFFYTLRLMLVKTGYVTREYINGRRVPFIKPLSMFFVVNLIYFLFPVADTFNSQLTTQMNYLPYRRIATQMVTAKIVREQGTLEDFRIRYDQQSTSLAKLLLIVFVFLVAIPLMVLNFSKEKYFIDHLMTSFEFNSLLILIVLILIPWFIIFLDTVFTSTTHSISSILDDHIYSFIAGFICIILLYFMERRVYNQRLLWAIAKAVVLVPCLLFMLQTYRAILFLSTMWTL